LSASQIKVCWQVEADRKIVNLREVALQAPSKLVVAAIGCQVAINGVAHVESDVVQWLV